ncbi:inner membrane transporter RhtA [Nocardia transvalensis]|uniref:Inner membrane transporter RhtA n=1 Tax=Nocardia transvalensis TaxID=37333 RepID=A0A7W9PKS5_9NOCA|nr:EamA family transporter [Nocardia transvalensis]MBB5917518.1 inner membrane transporter RhtA [Nocardia transvalensis]
MVPAPLFVLAAAVSTQTGQAFGKQLFAQVGPLGVVALRLGIAAIVLVALRRPRALPRGAHGRTVVALGVAIAGMNLIYPALHYLPLGVASTLQLLGPLTVALLGSRRPADAGVVALAVVGLILVRDPAAGPLAWQGLALALLSAAAMGSYLMLSRRVGSGTGSRSMLALAVGVAALIGLPAGFAEDGRALAGGSVLLAGAAVALLSAVVPYSLEMAALQRLPAPVVGTLLTLEPVVAAMSGYVVLHEELSPRRWIGIACICAGAAYVTLSSGRRSRAGRPGI